jgi:5-methylcytosine-specific restriction enzyme A
MNYNNYSSDMHSELKWFYDSLPWKKLRDAYKKAKFGICERCFNPAKIVHHKIHLDKSNVNKSEISLNWDNLELMCVECHNKHHYRKYNILPSGYKFDECGQIIKI